MTELMVEWLREFWDRRHVMQKLGTLVFVAFKSHNIESEQSTYRSVAIAGGMTTQLQVLRQTMLAVQGATAIWDLLLTQAGNITLSEVLIGQWIKTALNDISPESITGVFRKCCVSNIVKKQR